MANKLFDKIVREELINVLNEQRGVLYKDNPGSKKGGMSPSQMAAIGGRLKIKRGDKITYDRHFRFGKVSRDEVGTVVAFDGKHKLQLDDGPQLDLRITPIKKINGKVIKEQAWANKDGKPLDFEYDPGKGKLKEDYSQRARNFRVALRRRLAAMKAGKKIKYGKLTWTALGNGNFKDSKGRTVPGQDVVQALKFAVQSDIMKHRGAAGDDMVNAYLKFEGKVTEATPSLPSEIKRYMEKFLSAIRGANLNRQKQKVLLAGLIEALKIDSGELMMLVNKIKKGLKTEDKEEQDELQMPFALVSSVDENKLTEATSLWKHFDAKMKLQDTIMDLEYDMKMINKDLSQLYKDMEQEAEPEGGPKATRYGRDIEKKEKEYKKKKAEFKKLMAKLDKMEQY